MFILQWWCCWKWVRFITRNAPHIICLKAKSAGSPSTHSVASYSEKLYQSRNRTIHTFLTVSFRKATAALADFSARNTAQSTWHSIWKSGSRAFYPSFNHPNRLTCVENTARKSGFNFSPSEHNVCWKIWGKLKSKMDFFGVRIHRVEPVAKKLRKFCSLSTLCIETSCKLQPMACDFRTTYGWWTDPTY